MFKKKDVIMPEWLIVGLGNPGSEYRGTRHNVGFEVIDRLAERSKTKLSRSKHRSLFAAIDINGVGVQIVKPLTYMNLSGQSVKPWMTDLKLTPSRVLIIADDLDLPTGKIRFREKGSSGGHNGHKSITQSLGTSEYPRLKIGIGKGDSDTIDHVLGSFNGIERTLINEAVDRTVECIEALLSGGTPAILHSLEN